MSGKGLLLFAAAALCVAACNRNNLTSPDPAAVDDMGSWASMAIDAQGTLHLSYYWASHAVGTATPVKVGALMYVTGKVGADNLVTWSKPQRVDGDVRISGQGDVGLYTSLKVGSDGNPRISYHDVTNKRLKLATLASNAWTLEVPDPSSNDVGGYSSLVLEGDNPRIAYYDFTAKALKLAVKNAAGWTVSVIDNGGNGTRDMGQFCSLASDGSGGLGIAYYDATDGRLTFIEGTAAGFPAASTAAVFLDTNGDVGRWPKLAYQGGNPRIAYEDYKNQHLKFARKDNNAWALSTVDGTAWRGADTSLAIDPAGNFTIAYFDGLNNDAMSARWNGNAWTLADVGPTGANGYFNNVVLDASNTPIYGWYSFTTHSYTAQRVP